MTRDSIMEVVQQQAMHGGTQQQELERQFEGRLSEVCLSMKPNWMSYVYKAVMRINLPITNVWRENCRP